MIHCRPIRPTSPYLIILAVRVVAATHVLLNALASTQDIAGITHTGLRAGTRAGGGFSKACFLTRICTRFIVAVWGTAQC